MGNTGSKIEVTRRVMGYADEEWNMSAEGRVWGNTCRVEIQADAHGDWRSRRFAVKWEMRKHGHGEVGDVKYLVFRALGAENGKEELAVSVLTLGELEGSKDLSKRGRGCLVRVSRGTGEGERERDGPGQGHPGRSRGCAGRGGRRSSWVERRERRGDGLKGGRRGGRL